MDTFLILMQNDVIIYQGPDKQQMKKLIPRHGIIPGSRFDIYAIGVDADKVSLSYAKNVGRFYVDDEHLSSSTHEKGWVQIPANLLEMLLKAVHQSADEKKELTRHN